MLKLAIIASKISPYRIPVYRRLSRIPGVHLQVIFCAEREPNRQWELPPLDFDHVMLRERINTIKGRYIHNNPDVIQALWRFSPDVIVTSGFSPTHLYAFAYASMTGAAHVPMTDGTYLSEQRLSKMHRMVRRLVYARSRAFVSASDGGQHLYESYGIPAQRCFKSCLCSDNEAFSPTYGEEEKEFDFIFCGRIEESKNPLFALEVAFEAAARLHRKIRMLFVGAGNLEESVRIAAMRHSDLVDVQFHGFASQRELPSLYQRSRIFLFPTLADVWGVVANEACAAGLPVLISPYAGAAGELIVDGQNGFVCELDIDLWADRAAQLLTQQDMWNDFSARSLSHVAEYTYDNAAAGLLDACRFSRSAGAPQPVNETA